MAESTSLAFSVLRFPFIAKLLALKEERLRTVRCPLAAYGVGGKRSTQKWQEKACMHGFLWHGKSLPYLYKRVKAKLLFSYFVSEIARRGRGLWTSLHWGEHNSWGLRAPGHELRTSVCVGGSLYALCPVKLWLALSASPRCGVQHEDAGGAGDGAPGLLGDADTVRELWEKRGWAKLPAQDLFSPARSSAPGPSASRSCSPPPWWSWWWRHWAGLGPRASPPLPRPGPRPRTSSSGSYSVRTSRVATVWPNEASVAPRVAHTVSHSAPRAITFLLLQPSFRLQWLVLPSFARCHGFGSRDFRPASPAPGVPSQARFSASRHHRLWNLLSKWSMAHWASVPFP